MLVSLLSYSQYPAVKTIGKDTVVIMTVKQGEDINKTFSVLKDSIDKLNTNFIKTNNELLFTKDNSLKLDSTLQLTSNSLLMSENEIKRLNSLIKQNDKAYWQEKRTWAGWMLFSAFMTVLVAIIK